jgi:2,4-dienoyl-CoA reductase-like NADH-dependent reductase (Old Yellow Enzyme family)
MKQGNGSKATTHHINANIQSYMQAVASYGLIQGTTEVESAGSQLNADSDWWDAWQLEAVAAKTKPVRAQD